jgi:hypothetical protein
MFTGNVVNDRTFSLGMLPDLIETTRLTVDSSLVASVSSSFHDQPRCQQACVANKGEIFNCLRCTLYIYLLLMTLAPSAARLGFCSGRSQSLDRVVSLYADAQMTWLKTVPDFRYTLWCKRTGTV